MSDAAKVEHGADCEWNPCARCGRANLEEVEREQARPEDAPAPPPDPRDEWVTLLSAFRSWADLESHMRYGYIPTLRPRLFFSGSHEERATRALRIEVALWLVRERAWSIETVARSMCPMLDERERAQLDQRVQRELGEPAGGLFYVVTQNPSDYPGKVVVRAHRLQRDGTTRPDSEPLTVAVSLEEARAAIPEGLVCLRRSPDDDPVIVECWV